jgi:hypothetical protein
LHFLFHFHFYSTSSFLVFVQSRWNGQKRKTPKTKKSDWNICPKVYTNQASNSFPLFSLRKYLRVVCSKELGDEVIYELKGSWFEKICPSNDDKMLERRRRLPQSCLPTSLSFSFTSSLLSEQNKLRRDWGLIINETGRLFSFVEVGYIDKQYCLRFWMHQ